jgi:hypothetical protein
VDSRAVADALGTDPKTLRRFLRSDASSVTPVGSGGRYEFAEEDMLTMHAEFAEWMAGSAPKPQPTPKPVQRVRTPRSAMDRDRAVWLEEGPVTLPDIRQPAVLQAVRAAEAARERRLTALMMQAGLTTRPRTSARV